MPIAQTILLLDDDPRISERARAALAPLGGEVIATRTVADAVASCAKVEPRIVLIASTLTEVRVDDAITQLRALAGLRHTPFLVLMSGYSGADPGSDSLKLGAQGIIARAFDDAALLAAVRALLARPRQDATSAAEARSEILDAARRTSASTVTSAELFGDLISDEAAPSPAATQRITLPPPPVTPRPATGHQVAADEAAARTVGDALADLGLSVPKAAKPRKDGSGISVDKLLEDTLSGLEVGGRHATGRREATLPPPPAAVPPPAPSGAAPLPAGTPFGQYELIESIATGGMAEVYRARMKGVEGFQKIVAIKRILPHLTDNDEFVSMFVDEAKLAAQLQHPNIIHIYDLGKIERSYYIAMEFIDGKDLRSILHTLEEKRARLPLGLALFIASRLAAALDYAHRKKDLQGQAMALVHRDVSPQNVLISFDGDIKLCDFGIAKAASKASHTRAGALKGKLQYMSPEQAWGKDIDRRSDIFSLGLVLYEMLTGRKAFAGDSELSVLEQARAAKIVAPREIDPSIPPEVERIVGKALAEDCDQRYQTAGDLATDLGNILQLIRPAPGAAELGSFVADLLGHERPVSSAAPPAPRPAAAPPPPEAPRPEVPAPESPKPAPTRLPVMEPVGAGSEEPPTAPRPNRILPVAAAVAAAVLVAAIVLVSRAHRAPVAATATPAPETIEMAHKAAEQEVARQTEAMRQRLAGEALTPAAPTAGAAEPAARPAAAARPQAAPAGRPPAQAASRAVAPAQAPPTPAPVATAPPTVAPVVVLPTAAPPTAPPATAPPAPTSTPVPVATRAPVVATPVVVHRGDLVELGPGVVPPELVARVMPAYPPLAARAQIGGTVLLELLVDETGAVTEVRVLRGIKPNLGLDEAAVAAARKWRFKPATKDGVPVKVYITESTIFKP